MAKIAVLLVNFGGPTKYEMVKPFLYNLFSDPVILNVSNEVRKPLAWFISNMRDFNSRIMYKCVNGSSPLIPISYLVKDKVQQLFKINNLPIDVFTAFRYCEPFIDKVLTDLKNKNYKKIVIFPMFPQYSFTTTGSVQLVVDNWLKEQNDSEFEIFFVKDWYKDNDYLEGMARNIDRACRHVDLNSTEILFSAHSIPMFNIQNGDPYEKQINETAKLIIDKLNWKRQWHLGYQSKVGPVKWLEPSTDSLITELAKSNKNLNLLVVPISFVCEHVETIYEIGKLYKDLAKKDGIKNFVRIPTLNTSKYLVQTLYNQILGCLSDNQVSTKDILLGV